MNGEALRKKASSVLGEFVVPVNRELFKRIPRMFTLGYLLEYRPAPVDRLIGSSLVCLLSRLFCLGLGAFTVFVLFEELGRYVSFAFPSWVLSLGFVLVFGFFLYIHECNKRRFLVYHRTGERGA